MFFWRPAIDRYFSYNVYLLANKLLMMIDFLFDFNRNYVTIFYRFRDIAGYLSKVADFDPPHLHLAPP